MLGLRVVLTAVEGDRVQGAVELAVAAAAEAIANGLTTGGGDGRHAGQAGEGGFGADAAAV